MNSNIPCSGLERGGGTWGCVEALDGFELHLIPRPLLHVEKRWKALEPKRLTSFRAIFFIKESERRRRVVVSLLEKY